MADSQKPDEGATSWAAACLSPQLTKAADTADLVAAEPNANATNQVEHTTQSNVHETANDLMDLDEMPKLAQMQHMILYETTEAAHTSLRYSSASNCNMHMCASTPCQVVVAP